MVGNLSERTSLLWGILARGPAGGGEFERGDQLVWKLSEGASRWWGI